MYQLHQKQESSDDPQSFLISYDWDFNDNHEWRECVFHFLHLAVEFGHSAAAVTVPPFESGEDFVILNCRINGGGVSFSCDACLSLIVVTAQDAKTFGAVWSQIGERVGWAY
jgi:hypothetical protein